MTELQLKIRLEHIGRELSRCRTKIAKLEREKEKLLTISTKVRTSYRE